MFSYLILVKNFKDLLFFFLNADSLWDNAKQPLLEPSQITSSHLLH